MMLKWLSKAGIPQDAIAKIMAYAATQEKLKKSMKFNDKAKLDTSQIDDRRSQGQRWDAKSATKGYK